MGSDSSVDRGPGAEPWAIPFTTLVTFVGCVITAMLFAALLYVWLRFVVPDGILAADDSAARITAVVGMLAGALILLFGPFVALLLGRLLRRSASTAVHVIAFAFTGSVVGGLSGALLGPDVAVTLLATLGLATGLARWLVSPLARKPFTEG